jgi:hypothetical protein
VTKKTYRDVKAATVEFDDDEALYETATPLDRRADVLVNAIIVVAAGRIMLHAVGTGAHARIGRAAPIIRRIYANEWVMINMKIWKE